MRPFYFLVVFLVPISVIVGYLHLGWLSFPTPLVVFGIVPVLDLFVGDYVQNHEQRTEQQLSDDLLFRLIT